MNKNHKANVKILHLVNSFSGAKRYSIELISQKVYYHTVYIYCDHNDIEDRYEICCESSK